MAMLMSHRPAGEDGDEGVGALTVKIADVCLPECRRQDTALQTVRHSPNTSIFAIRDSDQFKMVGGAPPTITSVSVRRSQSRLMARSSGRHRHVSRIALLVVDIVGWDVEGMNGRSISSSAFSFFTDPSSSSVDNPFQHRLSEIL
jgi:hypothetical protein